MRSVESRSVYKINNKIYYCIREINAVKHGACLETSFQPSVYRSLLSESIVSSIGRCYTRVVVRVYTRRASLDPGPSPSSPQNLFVTFEPCGRRFSSRDTWQDPVTVLSV